MVSASQCIGNGNPAKLRRPRVVRIIKQSARSISAARWSVRRRRLFRHILRTEAFKPGRVRIPQRPRQQPNYGIHDHRRSQFSTRQNIIANRDLAVAEYLVHPLVHAFIASADNDDPFRRSKLLRYSLRKRAPLCGQQNDGFFLPLSFRFRRNPQRSYGIVDRLRLQHHTFAPAKRSIVDSAVAIMGKAAKVMRGHFDQSCCASAFENPVVQGTIEEARKDRNNIEAHRSPV